jgi:hypothetical protein
MMVIASHVSFLWSSVEYQTGKSITFVPLQIYLIKQTKGENRTLKIESMEKVPVYILDPGFPTSRTIWVMPAL